MQGTAVVFSKSPVKGLQGLPQMSRPPALSALYTPLVTALPGSTELAVCISVSHARLGPFPVPASESSKDSHAPFNQNLQG